MSTRKLIKRKMLEYKFAYQRANKHLYRILDVIDFTGFGEDHPDIMNLSNGDIIITWNDVDIKLKDAIPYINERGELTKENWYRMIMNQKLEKQ